MKCDLRKGFSISILLGVLFLFGQNSVSAQNTISGLIFNDNRTPIANIDIELLDNFERLVRKTKTNGSGLYIFPRLPAGVYYLRINVDNTLFKDVKERIDLGSTNRPIGGSRISGVENKQKDFYLQIDPQKKGNNPNAITGVVFAQNIPKEAENLFNQSLKDIKKNKQARAIESLEKAIRIFPDYFNALDTLGEIYLSQKRFEESENILNKAVSINPRSFRTFFNLAISQGNLKKIKDAVKSLKIANQIESKSINAHLLLGINQRKLKQFEEAEKTLLRAKNLSNNKEADVNWQLAELFYFELKKFNEAADELEFYLRNLNKTERKKYAKKIETVKKLIKKIRTEAK